MPASMLNPPDLATLLEPGTLVKAACKALLDPTVLPTFTQRSKEELPETRIDVTFAQNAWTGRWLPDQNGDLQHSAWRFTLTFAVHTTTDRETAPDDTDPQDVAKRKIKALIGAAIKDPSFLAWHCIAELNEKSSTESVMEAEDADVSALVYDGLITVRSDAMRNIGAPPPAN